MSDSPSAAGPLIHGVPLALWIAVGVALLAAVVTLVGVLLSNRNSRRNLSEQLKRGAEQFAAQAAHDSRQHERTLAEFERDLLRERVRSGIVAARKRGVIFGRRPGQRVKPDRFTPEVLKFVGEGKSYREISHRLGLSKKTVLDIVKRDRAA
jgi:DNA-binding NarL/FixJ family response regulator